MNHLENGYVDVDDVLFTRLSVIVDRLFDVGRSNVILFAWVDWRLLLHLLSL